MGKWTQGRRGFRSSCCIRSSAETGVDNYADKPPVIQPRVMAQTQPIRIYPLVEGLKLEQEFDVKFDKRISKNVISIGSLGGWTADAAQGVNKKQIVDSQGNKYTNMGFFGAQWRCVGGELTIADDFVVTDSPLRPDMVLMRDEERNHEGVASKQLRSFMPLEMKAADKRSKAEIAQEARKRKQALDELKAKRIADQRDSTGGSTQSNTSDSVSTGSSK